MTSIDDILPVTKCRLTVELREDQIRWLKSLPYGMRKPLLQAMVDDLIGACSVEGNKKYDILGALVSRTIKLQDIGNSLLAGAKQ